MTKEKEIYYDYLFTNNIKHSRQRERILDTFLMTEDHLTAQDIFEIARKEDSNLGIATVYRAMKLFCDAGLADIIDVGDGNKRYEHKVNHKHHDHLICVKCGKIIEFHNSQIEKIQLEVCDELDFKATSHKLQIYGICKECN